MSGIELAGLVLGTFPLVTFALEQYREAKRTALRWWRIERVYSRAVSRLEYERLFLRLQLRKLLLPLVTEGVLGDDDLEPLLADLNDAQWEVQDRKNALEQRLGDGYDQYVVILGEILEGMTDVWHLMGGEDSAFRAEIARRLVCR